MIEYNSKKKDRKDIIGFVKSKSGNKTIKVEFSYKIPHFRYKKEIKRRKVFHVHDEKNEALIGDRVKIIETRPLSKNKRFRLIEILKI
jgi:small subunit ribosomal protein S17